MPAGFKYNLDPIERDMPEMCRFDTAYRLSGGFNLVLDNLEKGSFIPPMAPLAIDFKTRKATACKNVLVIEDATAAATSLKIAKNSLVYKDMFVGNGSKGAKVSAIDKANSNYDVLTLAAALGEAIAKETVLFEASAVDGKEVKNKAVTVNYATTKVEDGATVTAVGQVYEIRVSKLIAPVSEKDKENLGHRFMWTY